LRRKTRFIDEQQCGGSAQKERDFGEIIEIITKHIETSHAGYLSVLRQETVYDAGCPDVTRAGEADDLARLDRNHGLYGRVTAGKLIAV